MAAYVVSVCEVTNPHDNFKKYVEKSAALLAEVGGEYVIRGPAAKVYEGDYLTGKAVIITKLPDMDAVNRYIGSDTYQKEIKPLREGSGIYDIGVYEGA